MYQPRARPQQWADWLVEDGVLVGDVGIHRIERFRHIEAVQPHLVGIRLLVPEGARLGARLVLELPAGRLDGHGVPDVRGGLIQADQRPGRADMVQVELFQVVFAADLAALVQDAVVPGAHIRVEFGNVIGTGNG